ncbi:hypothetical protein [Nitrososphaera sp.]|uniref:hypothetical protein n=1 Tax=Nitrososphaera sp. TaxID=1971748 RepID=UPI00307F64E9
MQSSQSRPTGVTIIAILNIIGGIIMLVGGISALTAGAVLPMMGGTLGQTGVPGTGTPELSNISTSLLGGGAIVVGAVMIGLAIFSFVVAWGLLKGRGWAWTATVVLAVISIVMNAISLVAGNWAAIISIIISGVIIYYMYRPHVKAFFGKSLSHGTARGDTAAA